MSKKRSFFERLAGNLRFDDSDDEFEDTIPEPRRSIQQQPSSFYQSREQVREKDAPVNSGANRELIIKSSKEELPKNAEPILEEEIGELPVDVYETPNEIIIQTLIAGVLPEHLAINITRDQLTVSGKREENRTITDDQYHYRELYWGAFARTVDLPAEVEIDGAEAIERHGMLMIKLPKLDKKRKASLKIKSI